VKPTWLVQVMFFGVTWPSVSPACDKDGDWRDFLHQWVQSLLSPAPREKMFSPGGDDDQTALVTWGDVLMGVWQLPLEENLLLVRGRQRRLQGEGETKLFCDTSRRHENLL